MKKLLRAERIGDRIEKDWVHYGEDGKKKVTTETIEDVSPVFSKVKQAAERQSSKSEFRLKASIPVTVIEDMSKLNAKIWGVSVKDAFSEIVTQKTDRAKKVLKMLTDGMDYNKLQTKTYR